VEARKVHMAGVTMVTSSTITLGHLMPEIGPVGREARVEVVATTLQVQTCSSTSFFTSSCHGPHPGHRPRPEGRGRRKGERAGPSLRPWLHLSWCGLPRGVRGGRGTPHG